MLRRAAGESRGRRAGARAGWRWPPLATAVAVCVALVVSPFGGDDAGVVDRALAAIGDGPVLHVVTRSPGMGGTLVDLQSGERTQLRIEQETWFDPDRGFRATIRLGRNRARGVQRAGGQARAHAIRVPGDGGVQPRLPGRAARGPRASA